ncbi:hypothetical protein SUDANB176_06674 [Streptomyces sp. enrichment culture]
MAGPATGNHDHGATAPRSGEVTLVVTRAPQPRTAVARHVEEHGDATADLASSCDGVQSRFDRAPLAGATALPRPTPSLLRGQDTWAAAVDHAAVRLAAGTPRRTAEFHEAAFGMPFCSSESIGAGNHAMDPIAARNAESGITITLIEPDDTRVPGRANRFLRDRGPPAAGLHPLAPPARHPLPRVHPIHPDDAGTGGSGSPAAASPPTRPPKGRHGRPASSRTRRRPVAYGPR